ncbi:MAG TPA: FtsW/RodA/SpoVE family cell cycle protein [Candidatus Limnocylindrales bacterium]|nr:FtsW/RodA/SpoVE family cell cycle protein [Candidatus Limnocylindrales bacterium]
MGALRLEPARVQAWASRSASAVWSAFDIQLVLYALSLAVIGLLVAYVNSPSGNALAAGTTLTRGLVWLALAIIAFIVAASFDYRWLKSFAWPLYLVNIGLLVLSMAVGTGGGGTSRWVVILGFQFQFSELCKILMIVVMGNWLASRQGRMASLGTIVGAILLVAPPMVLVLLQPDLGTSLVFVAILAGTLFLAGASLRWMGALGAAVLAVLPFVWAYVLRDYQKQRLLSFLDPSADPLGSGYHLLQSQLAVTSGGLFGQGPSATSNQLTATDLPVQSTDFAFAVLAQALGFVGALVVLGLFVALLWRILRVGWRSDDPFGLVFAAGLASMIVFQMLVNIGMIIGLMPITGIPLPFITHGGASIVCIGLGLGILESINLRQAKPKW